VAALFDACLWILDKKNKVWTGCSQQHNSSSLVSPCAYTRTNFHLSTRRCLPSPSTSCCKRDTMTCACESSSTSLPLVPALEKPSYHAQRDHAAAYGAPASHYGASRHSSAMASIPIQPPTTLHVALPVHENAPEPNANVKQIRAESLGALQNKYGAIGYGAMTSGI
jgi:hypothetical protein